MALLLVSLHKFLCLRILHLTCGFDLTKLAQCQSEICFRNAHFSEWHTMPNWNMSQDGTCFVVRTIWIARYISFKYMLSRDYLYLQDWWSMYVDVTVNLNRIDCKLLKWFQFTTICVLFCFFQTYNFLSALSKLCHSDTAMTHQLFVHLFPRLWKILNEKQQTVSVIKI